MACKILRSTNHLIQRSNQRMHMGGLLHFHFKGEKSPVMEEKLPPAEWREMAFLKLKKWSHFLKDFDLINGCLVRINDHSRFHHPKMEQRMQAFKSVAKVFIGLPSMKETIRNNLMASGADTTYTQLQYFCKEHEREALTVNSLAKIAELFPISSQQKGVIRQTICRQVTQHKVWNGALTEILNAMKSDIDVLVHTRPTKEIRLAQQIIVSFLKFLASATSYNPEASSWMRLMPTKEKAEDSDDSPKWKDALEMCIDLLNCLTDENDLAFHVSKLEGMKEGLYQIRDIVVDKNIGYKENRYQEHLMQKKLTKTLGFPSPCLFTLVLYYLYGCISNVEVDFRGGIHELSVGGKLLLYMGMIITSDSERAVLNGMRKLDRALGLFKFVWDTAGIKGELVLQGHLWCVGATHRVLSYRGNVYYLHEIVNH